MTRLNSLPERYQDQIEQKKNSGDNTKLIIPGELPTMNEIINQSKIHWSKYKKMKETYDSIVAFYAEQQRVKLFKSVKLEIIYYRKDRRVDPDNLSAGKKFIIDGLVQAGVLEEDGWSEIKGFSESWKVDKDNPRTEINFEEVE
ncbi:MAG: Holliday junction resolvase [Petrotogales bacterium]